MSGFDPQSDFNQQSGYNQTPQYGQNQYNQPVSSQQYGANPWPHMKIGDWVISLLLMLVPIVNIVLACMWAFGSDVNPSKKSFFQAYLIFIAAGIVLGILLSAALGAIFIAVLDSLMLW